MRERDDAHPSLRWTRSPRLLGTAILALSIGCGADPASPCCVDSGTDPSDGSAGDAAALDGGPIAADGAAPPDGAAMSTECVTAVLPFHNADFPLSPAYATDGELLGVNSAHEEVYAFDCRTGERSVVLDVAEGVSIRNDVLYMPAGGGALVIAFSPELVVELVDVWSRDRIERHVDSLPVPGVYANIEMHSYLVDHEGRRWLAIHETNGCARSDHRLTVRAYSPEGERLSSIERCLGNTEGQIHATTQGVFLVRRQVPVAFDVATYEISQLDPAGADPTPLATFDVPSQMAVPVQLRLAIERDLPIYRISTLSAGGVLWVERRDPFTGEVTWESARVPFARDGLRQTPLPRYVEREGQGFLHFLPFDFRGGSLGGVAGTTALWLAVFDLTDGAMEVAIPDVAALPAIDGDGFTVSRHVDDPSLGPWVSQDFDRSGEPIDPSGE